MSNAHLPPFLSLAFVLSFALIGGHLGPQDDPSFPVGSGIRLLIEPPGARCVNRSWAQHVTRIFRPLSSLSQARADERSADLLAETRKTFHRSN